LAQEPAGVEAFSRPRRDVALSFMRPGVVAKVLVAEGDRVKAGQAIIQLDDSAERIQVEQLRAEAEDMIRIEAAQAQWNQTQVDLKKIERAFLSGGATELELQHAKLDVEIKRLTLELERFNKKQNELKYQEAKVMLDRMRMLSPIDGTVETVAVKEGEGVEALARVVRVVQTDPLWIDVPVPLEQGPHGLAIGRAATVVFDSGDGEHRRATGKIIKIGSVADAAGGTLDVRVEVANPSHRPAGERVYVTFPPPEAAGGIGPDVVTSRPVVKEQ